MPQLAIIIPCFNEAARIRLEHFTSYALKGEATFIFVDDGSTDATLEKLQLICGVLSDSILLKLKKNKGKGEAVRQGLKYALRNGYEYLGYLDADLSTPVSELIRIYHILRQTPKVSFAFGSRVLKADSHIKRSLFRHYIGRVIVTVIDLKFRLRIYDTQCGAKVFRKEVLKPIMDPPFKTRWLFDVELILRIQKMKDSYYPVEVPLLEWQHVPGSKINILSAPRVLREIATLYHHY